MNTVTTTTPTLASVPAETIEGWALLKPLNDVPAWDLIELWEGLEGIIGDFTGPVKPSAATVAKVLRLMRKVALDDAAFTQFASGPEGMRRSVDLALAWLSELGKSAGSVS